MKKNLTIVMGMLLLLSWYITLSTWLGNSGKYQECMEEAQRLEEKGLYLDALQEYENAREIKGDTLEIEEKIADNYLAMGDTKKYRNKLNDIIEKYGPTEQNVNKLVSYYKEFSSQNSLIDCLVELYKKYPESEIINQHYDSIKGFYEEEFFSVENIDDFQGKYATFENSGKKGLLNEDGDIIIEAVYDEIIYNGKDTDSITVKDGNEVFWVNEDGYKTKETDDTYDGMGALSNQRVLVEKNGKYGYLDSNLKLKIEPQYDAATAFYKNMAAVKKGDKWAIINRKGEAITEFIYDNVAVNSRNVCSENEVIGVCQSGKWFLIDEKGERIGENEFQNMKAFESEQPCAVCINDKWGFMDKEGNVVIEGTYEEAKSFKNGFAPIRENKLWGFIDMENYKFMSGTFDDVRGMTTEGVAPVAHGDSWTLIRLKVMD